MSTRCNVIIRNGEKTPVVVYHHMDGYPKGGVGEDLFDLMSKIINQKEKWTDGETLAETLHKSDSGYQVEPYLSGDIQYLYEIDLVHHSISCFTANLWELTDRQHDNIIKGCPNKKLVKLKYCHGWDTPKKRVYELYKESGF